MSSHWLRRQERSRQRLVEAAIGWAALVAAPASGPWRERRVCRNRNGTPVEVEVIVRMARPGELDPAPAGEAVAT